MSSSETEKLAVIAVAKNYVKAFKEVKPDLIKKHFLPQCIKTGYFYDYENNSWMDMSIHSLKQVLDWAAQYNVNAIMPDSDVSTTLLDIQEKTAIVKVVAEWAPGRWGVDYIILAKDNSAWLIAGIFWESVIVAN